MVETFQSSNCKSSYYYKGDKSANSPWLQIIMHGIGMFSHRKTIKESKKAFSLYTFRSKMFKNSNLTFLIVSFQRKIKESVTTSVLSIFRIEHMLLDLTTKPRTIYSSNHVSMEPWFMKHEANCKLSLTTNKELQSPKENEVDWVNRMTSYYF